MTELVADGETGVARGFGLGAKAFRRFLRQAADAHAINGLVAGLHRLERQFAAVRVTIHKPHAPIAATFDDVGVGDGPVSDTITVTNGTGIALGTLSLTDTSVAAPFGFSTLGCNGSGLADTETCTITRSEEHTLNSSHVALSRMPSSA